VDGRFCAACGADTDGAHDRCAELSVYDPPRFCTRCGRRLDVQVLPTRYVATCRRCDGVHPARRPA
jgi:hypothetical protein